MTLSWIEAQIENAKDWGNDRDSVRDLAALLIVRGHLRTAQNPEHESSEDAKKRQAIVLTAHSADLDVVPTLEQAEQALAAVAVNTPEERERAVRAKTWAEILR